VVKTIQPGKSEMAAMQIKQGNGNDANKVEKKGAMM
jgi:hypothetical protein